MKKILIVNKSFELGGIQTSMINMANTLSQHYEVHLFIYNPEGILKERLCDDVKILDSSWLFKCIGMSLKDALQTKEVKIILFRLFAALWAKLFNNILPLNLAIMHQTKMTGYDLAIAYHQEQRKKSVTSGFVRVVDKCVVAKKKVAWIHYDSNSINLDHDFNYPFYQKMDKVVCVSKSLMNNFADTYPELKKKMDYCYNFMLYDVIKEKGLEKQKVNYPLNKFVCFSACRLTEEKALVRGITALSKVMKQYKDIVWYIAGDGVERNNIENAIREHKLENQIILIGNQSNPYPYIRNANLVLNVSFHEAAPMIFFESKALGTPIFATRTASAEELIDDNKDSFICENSEVGIYERFEWIIQNKKHLQTATSYLMNYHSNNEESLLKIKNLIK